MGAQQVDQEISHGALRHHQYQTTHLCGGAIMGTDPKTSALNRYLQSWDVPNLFVMGASGFPAERRLQSDRHVAALAYLVGGRDPQPIPQEPGAAGPCMSGAAARALIVRDRGGGSLSSGSAVRRGSGATLRHAPTSRTSRRSSADAISRSVADCAACHDEPVATAPFAGGRPIETPFGNMLAAQYHARPRHRHRRIGATRSSMRRFARGRMPDGSRLYPAMPYPVLHEDVARRRARDSRLSQYGSAGASSQSCANQLPFPFNIRSLDGSSGTRSISPGRIPARSLEVAPHGTAAPISSRVPAIAAPAIRRRPSSAAMSQTGVSGLRLQGWFAPDITDNEDDGSRPLVTHRHRGVPQTRSQ